MRTKHPSLRWKAALLGAALALFFRPAKAEAWELFRSKNDNVERGNALLREGNTEQALEAYDAAARELPGAPGVHLGRGTALLRAQRLDEAREALRLATQGAASPDVRAKAHYNLGLSFLEEADALAQGEDFEASQKRLREAVDAFKSSLRAAPGNRDAAWNLELAKRRLMDVEQKREQQKQKEEQEKQQKQDQEQQQQGQEEQPQESPPGEQGDEPKDDGNGDERQEPSDDASDTPSPGEQQDQKDAQQPTQPQQDQAPKQQDQTPSASPEQREGQAQPALPQHMSKALDALSDSEESLQKHQAVQQARQRPRRVEKDW